MRKEIKMEKDTEEKRREGKGREETPEKDCCLRWVWLFAGSTWGPAVS
jgi:hypothetical protein